MRILTTLGVVALAFSSNAFAGTCVGGAPANDCDNDGVLDIEDPCPFSTNNALTSPAVLDENGLTIGAACWGANVTNNGAFLQHGISVGTGGQAVTLGEGSIIGAYTMVGTDALNPTTIAPKAKLAAAPSAADGTVMGSGFLGRRSDTGTDPAGGDPAKEGGANIGTGLSSARAVEIGYGAQIGNSVTLGYASTVGPRATIGNNTRIANIATVGFGATVGANSRVGRAATVGNFSVLADNTTLSPEVQIGAYAEIGATRGNPSTSLGTPGLPIKIRRGVIIGSWTQIYTNTRLGRGVDVGDYSSVEEGVILRAHLTVGAGGVATAGGSAASDNFYRRGENIPGNTTNVPKEPSGTFFSAAGGVVCVDTSGDGVCQRLPTNGAGVVVDPAVDAVVSYCLDEVAPFGACDPGAANTAAQAIVITAPDTIGVSPYSYNISSGTCPDGTPAPATCTVTVSNANYQLQAGPIFVLSPPTP